MKDVPRWWFHLSALGTGRVKSAFLAVAVITATITLLSVASYIHGRSLDGELRFLEPRRAPTVDEAIHVYAAEYALRSTEANDVVFIGDSTCADGVDPAAFERLTGLRSYNLGTQGALGPTGYLVILRGYLEHHPKPRLVVLCVSPLVFSIDVHSESSERFIANYGPEVSGIVPWAYSAAYFAKRGAVSLLPAPDPRGEHLEFLEAETFRTLKEKFSARRGFHALTGEHALLRREPDPTAVPMREEWRDGVGRIVATSDHLGIPLLLLLTPLSRRASDSHDFSALDGLHARKTAVLIFADEEMWDFTHLNAAGVAKFMPIVAKDVQTALGK